MRCPSCGFENPAGMKFCGQCATPLSRRCPQCGFENPPGFAFCGQCATSLTEPPLAPRPQFPLNYTPAYLAEKILTSKTTLEGERKQVTVLFADLKGSMELLADRDPEEARQLLDPVLERMMAAVHRYEGTVNQVMGDGIMALFGAPIAHEDHAVRACYAALAMQDAIRHYSAEVRRAHGLEVQIRVGLHSGEVVVRAIGNDLHMDYSAEQAIDLRLALRVALRPFGDSGRLQTYLREAEALAAALDDPHRLGRVLRSRSSYAYFMGTYDQAIAAGERVLALATASGDIVQQAVANFQLGIAYEARMDMTFWLPEVEAALAQVEGR